MDNKSEFTIKVLQEVGLEIDTNDRVIDQDNNSLVKFKGKTLKFNPDKKPLINRTEIEFNPLENPNIMNYMMSYYVKKLEEEENRYIGMFFLTDTEDNGRAQCKENGKLVSSDLFFNDSVKYADLISKLNGNTSVDFSKYDDTSIVKRGRNA